MAKDYVVSVGRERIEEGFSGTLDRTTKQPSKKTSVMIPVGGYFIPTVSMAWGQRLINGKPRANGFGITATDNDYKGEIKFLPWGHEDGERILIQFLNGCSSLDKVYQEKRLNLVASNEESSLMLSQGENRFNFDSEETMIQYLKVCASNQTSPSRDPKIQGFTFLELGDKYKYNAKDVDSIEKESDAIGLVRKLSDSPEVLKVLFTIMGGTKVLEDVNDGRNALQIYPALLRFAKNSTSIFFSNIEQYKRRVSELFMKGESYQLMDYTTDGTIAITLNGKKKDVLTGIDAKGDAMKDWILLNYSEPKVFAAMSGLGEDLKNIK